MAQVTESDELDLLACACFLPHGTTRIFRALSKLAVLGYRMMQTTVQKAISILKAHVCKMPLFTITDDSNLGNMLVKSRKLLRFAYRCREYLDHNRISKRTKRVFRAAEVSIEETSVGEECLWRHIVWTPCRNDGPMPTETCGFSQNMVIISAYRDFCPICP